MNQQSELTPFDMQVHQWDGEQDTKPMVPCPSQKEMLQIYVIYSKNDYNFVIAIKFLSVVSSFDWHILYMILWTKRMKSQNKLMFHEKCTLLPPENP